MFLRIYIGITFGGAPLRKQIIIKILYVGTHSSSLKLKSTLFKLV